MWRRPERPPDTIPTLEQICAVLHEHRAELVRRYHLREIGVFGSYVRGEQQSTSDIDVLVDFEVTPSFFLLMALEDELHNLLDVPVDVAVKSSLRSHIGAQILCEVVSL